MGIFQKYKRGETKPRFLTIQQQKSRHRPYISFRAVKNAAPAHGTCLMAPIFIQKKNSKIYIDFTSNFFIEKFPKFWAKHKEDQNNFFELFKKNFMTRYSAPSI
jgi:hypothetical protein